MPICGDPVKRAARLTPLQRNIDAFAKTFLDQYSPDPAHPGERIREAASVTEHGAGIFLGPKGQLRFGTITTGDEHHINFDLGGRGSGEKLVGVIHTHPYNGLNFSRLDLQTAKQLAAENGKDFFGSYIAYDSPGGGYQFKAFEPARGMVTVVP